MPTLPARYFFGTTVPKLVRGYASCSTVLTHATGMAEQHLFIPVIISTAWTVLHRLRERCIVLFQ